MNSCRFVLTFIIVFILFAAVQAQTTTFNYQGNLNDAATPAAGIYDFEFVLYDQSGNLIASNLTATTGVTVTNGVFSVKLDFGSAAFADAGRFLEIRVKKPADSTYTTLSPRQQINSAPYSIRALSAATADDATALQNHLNGIGTLNAANNPVDWTKLKNVPAAIAAFSNSDYIQNTTAPQVSANFNIGGNGTIGGTLTAGIVNATTPYKINGARVLSIDGLNNLFVGGGAGFRNTTGNFNSFAGASSGVNNTTGSFNSFIGASAGFSNVTGNNNSFVGASAGFSNTGGNNSFFGGNAGYYNTSGGGNSFFGSTAGYKTTTGNSNSFFGNGAGFNNTIGIGNSFVGESVGNGNTTGWNNTFFGSLAGQGNVTGSYNTIIGNRANVAAADLQFATAIGAEALVSQSNTIALGRSNGADRVQIFGLGAVGSTRLCRNDNNEISTCADPTVAAMQKGVDENAAVVDSLREQVRRQEKEISELKAIVCSLKPDAAICKTANK